METASFFGGIIEHFEKYRTAFTLSTNTHLHTIHILLKRVFATFIDWILLNVFIIIIIS